MALISSVLVNEIRKFTDQSFGGFVAFPVDDAATAAAWASAIDAFANAPLALVPSFVVPVSTSGIAAKAAMQTALIGLSAPGAVIALFDVAFAAYATALAVGMAPAFTPSTPPPLLLSVSGTTIASVFAAGVLGADAHTQAIAMASLITLWFLTGSSVPSGGGSLVPWT